MQLDRLAEVLKNRKIVGAWFLLSLALMAGRYYGQALCQDQTVEVIWFIAVLGGLGCGFLLFIEAVGTIGAGVQALWVRRAEARLAGATAMQNLKDCRGRDAVCLIYIVYGTRRQRFFGPADNRQLATLVGLKLLQYDGNPLADGSVAYTVRKSVWDTLQEGWPTWWPKVDVGEVPATPPWVRERI